MRSSSLVNEQARTPTIAFALIFVALTVGLELAAYSPLRLPGHRALPGALALLLCAEAFVPWIVVAFSVAVPALLIATGTSHPLGWVAYVGTAAAIVGAAHYRRARGTDAPAATWTWLVLGLLFGGLMWLSKGTIGHKTPDAARVAGHLVFGGAGGGLAFGLSRLARGGAPHSRTDGDEK